MNMQTRSTAARLPLTSTRVARMLGWVSGTEGESRAQFLDADASDLHDPVRSH